jgi:hypothetical protein
MDAPELYHLAYLVEDLERARDELVAAGDHRFGPATRASMRVGEGWDIERTRPVTFPVTYSTEGPPYVEIIERGGHGIFGSEQPLGFHHAGYWEADPEGRAAALIRDGFRIESTVCTVSGSLLAFFALPPTVAGVRLEFVSSAYREKLEKWFRSAGE